MLNICGRVRTAAVFNRADFGNTVVPWAGKLSIDASKVSLSGGATAAEFARIYKWVQEANVDDKVPAGVNDRRLPPACLDWCAKQASAAAAPKPAGR